MESLSQQIKQLQQKNQELSNLENRIHQIKQQLKLQESNNQIIQKKVNKVIETKKHIFQDNYEISKQLERRNLHQEDYHNKIMMMRQIQNDETRRIKQEVLQEKFLRNDLVKQQSQYLQMQHQNRMKEELQKKQQQYSKISEWEFQLKQDLEQKRIEKIEKIRLEQLSYKNSLAQQIDQQSKYFQQLMAEEQDLLNKLQVSQQYGQNLRQDLSQAFNVSIKDYNHSSSYVGSTIQSFSQQKLMKQFFESPYAQVPNILKVKLSRNNLRELDHLLPQLDKPKVQEQQKQIERLYQRTNQLSKTAYKQNDFQFQNTSKNFSTQYQQTSSSKRIPDQGTHTNKFLTNTVQSKDLQKITAPKKPSTKSQEVIKHQEKSEEHRNSLGETTQKKENQQENEQTQQSQEKYKTEQKSEQKIEQKVEENEQNEEVEKEDEYEEENFENEQEQQNQEENQEKIDD